MNKEVIYLEPEDDITDILTKLQRAEQKLVALVPPKKATMLRSAVNMKLVARAAKECKKIVVIVTADPAISKMAMLAQIPVAKTLQSRPVVPTKESIAAAQAGEQVIDEDLADVTDQKELDSLKGKKDSAKTAGEGVESASEKTSAKSADTFELNEEGLENGSKDAKKDKNGQKVPNMSKARKWIILGSVAAVLAIVVGVWAFVFAPAVDIVVAMNTSSNNFSEEVRFTSEASKEDIEAGVFYLDQQTLSEKYTADFTATGEEDQGEKAKGEVTVTYSFKVREHEDEEIVLGITAGDKFYTSDGMLYYATSTESPFKWDGATFPVDCDTPVNNRNGTCVKTFTNVTIEAAKAGEEYNVKANTSWNKFEDVINATVTNSAAITGGTTKMVKTVTQKDVDKVKEDQVAEHTADGRSQLFDDLSDDLIVIESSFKAEAGDVTSTPAVGDTVGDNTTPNATVNVNFSVYTLDKAKVEQYIKAKMNVGEDQKIYSIGEPYFDRFTSIEEPARLKTVVKTGPTVTEEDILEKAKGRKIGEVQSLLRSINGVSSVEITPSFFWVRTVPNDDSKITIDLTVEDK